MIWLAAKKKQKYEYAILSSILLAQKWKKN